MNKQNYLIPLTWVALTGSLLAAEHDYYKYLRYPKGLVPGVGIDKVEQEGGHNAVGYQRRTVEWWPRKGQDVVDIPEGVPLRTWTRNQWQEDKEALAGLCRSWTASDPETFKAHLIGFRSICYATNQTITGSLVMDYGAVVNNKSGGVFDCGRFYRENSRFDKAGGLGGGSNDGALYANWQFNQPKSAMLEDAYVNNNGILCGRPEFAADGDHRCIVFNGKDQYAEAPPSVADFGELTIDMLVNRSSGDGRVFDFGTGDDECFYLAFSGGNGKLVLAATHNGKNHSLIASEGIPAGKWVRVRVEMDGSTASIHIDGKQAAKEAFAFHPRDVFIGDRPEGNFIACGRNRNEFFNGRMDHFRIYRKMHDDFAALGPTPAPLTQIPELSGTDKELAEAAKIHALQQKFIYHTTADWEGRTLGEVDGTAPPKLKKWLKDVRGD